MCVCRGCYLLFTDTKAELALPGHSRPLPVVSGLRAGSPRMGGAADPGRAGVLLPQLGAGPHRGVLSRARRARPSPSWISTRGTISAPPTHGWTCSPTTPRHCWCGCPTTKPQPPRSYLVPIDACYEFVGRLRMLWRGFDGGQEVREYIDEFFDHVDRTQQGDRVMTDVTFAVVDVDPEPYAVTPVLNARRRHRRGRRRTRARHRVALPGPHRTVTARLHRRRGRRAARPVRPARALGTTPAHLPVAAHHRDGAGIHRRHPGRPAAGVHLRLRGRGREVPACVARRHDPAAVPVQRNGFRRRARGLRGAAGAVGSRGPLRHAGVGMASS